MSSQDAFWFPYNFYPVTGLINGKKIRYKFDYTNDKYIDEETDNDKTLRTIARHDVLYKDNFSGFFKVEFKTISPLVVGNKQIKRADEPTEVEQYKWRNKFAIPANSLRGMIASNLEFLSQSTLRVLEPKFYNLFADENVDLQPWKNARDNLTTAEALLGVVPVKNASNTVEDNSNNLASRVIFHDAIIKKGEISNEFITLEKLSTPKYDGVQRDANGCPTISDFDFSAYNHYFKLNNDLKDAKHEDVRSNWNSLVPKGRKFYLRRENLNLNAYTANVGTDTHMKVKPIKGTFTTKISFNNVSKSELNLLYKSIYPSENYIHQVGLAKSLGFGQILINDIQINLLEVEERYSLDTFSCKNDYKIKEYKDDSKSDKVLNDESLIDSDSLTILCNLNNYDNLLEASDIHWRNNQNDNECSRPIPNITTLHIKAPKATEVTLEEEEKRNKKFMASLNDAIKDNTGIQWLSTNVREGVENLSLEELLEIFRTITVRKDISKIEDNNLRSEVIKSANNLLELKGCHSLEIAGISLNSFII